MKIDPRHHHRLHRSSRIVLAGLVLAAAGWAVMPDRAAPDGFSVDHYTHVDPTSPASQADNDPFDPAAFDVTLWHEPAPPEPPATPPRPAPPPRLTLQLMAISLETGPQGQPSPIAVVYDTQDDTVQTLRVGDRYRKMSIESIGIDSVEVRVGEQTVRLLLEQSGAG